MHQIRYFLAVAERLNFTRAAEECNVTQPSLSRAIQRLEGELGGPLFHRERSRTHLTSLGIEMLPLLRRVFEGAEAAKEQAESHLGSERALLRLGVSLTVHLALLSPLLAEMARAFPGLDLKLFRAPGGEIVKHLEGGDLELAVMADPEDNWHRLERWPMFEEGFAALVPPGWERQSMTFAEVDAAGVIARPYCETIRPAAETTTSRGGAARRRLEVWSEDDAAVLVRQGMGIAIVPDSAGRHLSGTTAALVDFDTTRTVGVYGVAGRRRSLAASAMLNLLRAADWSDAVSA